MATAGALSSTKSTLTFAFPFRRITTATSAVVPLVTCTVTGSLSQFGFAPAGTAAQAMGKARPENTTVPVGIPAIASTELAPAITSNVCTDVRVAPAAERLMQETSAGTVVIVTRTVPTSSGGSGTLQPACHAATKRAVTTNRTSVEPSEDFIGASLVHDPRPMRAPFWAQTMP